MGNPEFPPNIDSRLEQLIRLEELLNVLYTTTDRIADREIVVELPFLRDRADQLLKTYHDFSKVVSTMIKVAKEGHH